MAVQTISPTEYITKVEKLENETLKLKKSVNFVFFKKIFSLKGILKNIKITEKDIKQSRKGLFKNLDLI